MKTEYNIGALRVFGVLTIIAVVILVVVNLTTPSKEEKDYYRDTYYDLLVLDEGLTSVYEKVLELKDEPSLYDDVTYMSSVDDQFKILIKLSESLQRTKLHNNEIEKEVVTITSNYETAIQDFREGVADNNEELIDKGINDITEVDIDLYAILGKLYKWR